MRTCTLLGCIVLLGMVIGEMLGRAVWVEVRETVVVTVLQRVVILSAVLLVVFSTALEEGLRLHAFLAVVFVSLAVDGTGDTLCLTLVTLL